jgi:hypothetical protein
MYYHLLKNVLQARWPDYSQWNIFPDVHTGLNWNEVEDFLDLASMTTEIVRPFMTVGAFKLRLRTEFRIEDITPCESPLEPMIQVADLLAGLGAYSYEKFAAYCEWKRQNAAQNQLFALRDGSPANLSCSDRERCRVLAEFDSACKSRRLGVSLETYQGLRTFDPKNPINFWLYIPQHEKDIAPTHRSRQKVLGK